MWPFEAKFPENKPQDVDGREFDYVVVGGGTAGLALASKLSEDPSVSVLVIERGGVDDTWVSQIPLISSNFNMESSPAITNHRSVPIPSRGGFEQRLISSHILGGNTRINSSIATRGLPGGYNAWAEECGLTDWTWAQVEPYFRDMENAIDVKNDPSRGHSGPVPIRHIPLPVDFYASHERAYRRLGLSSIPSPNTSLAPAQVFTALETAVTDKGQRVSSYTAFLHARIANERRRHLTVCTRAAVTRLAISEDGTTVLGVHLKRSRKNKDDKNGADCFVKVRREAIICSGAFVSPLILMHSGIGPSEVLNKHDIPCIHDLPVGRNLRDHLLFSFVMESALYESVHALQNSIIALLWHLLLYIVWGVGFLATGPLGRAAFIKTDYLDEKTMTVCSSTEDGHDTMDPLSAKNVPDVEIMSLTSTGLDRNMAGKNLISVIACLSQPKSVGTLELASKDPEDAAKVDFPYLTDQEDVVVSRKAARFSMRLLEEFVKDPEYTHKVSVMTAPSINRTPQDWNSHSKGLSRKMGPLNPAVSGVPPSTETQAFIPRSEVEKSWDTVTDEEIDAYVLAVAIPGNHAASTCNMSVSPENGVVDQRFKVHGMKNLRVADASALPMLPSAHTMLPMMMFGLRCADFVKDEWAG